MYGGSISNQALIEVILREHAKCVAPLGGLGNLQVWLTSMRKYMHDLQALTTFDYE